MPIPRDAFDRGVSPAQEKLIAILDANPDQAYTDTELVRAMGYDAANFTSYFSFIWVTLPPLVQKGLVLSKVLGGVTYYASAKRR